MNLNIVNADYLDAKHEHDIQFLLNAYACDSMGGGAELEKEVLDNVVNALSLLPHAFSLIGYFENTPVALVNCFDSFSTFACKPLINIHDLFVIESYRGKGVAYKMLDKVEEIAIAKGCCKLTLEVLSKNEKAKSAYKKFGFSDYSLGTEAGTALFWQKNINQQDR